MITGLLIPALTRRWQDHQKELELKTNLVTEISQSVTRIVMAVQFAELGAAGQSQKTFDNAYREWEIQSRVIGSRLRAYFPDNSIGPDWNTYCESVTDFYALTGIDDVSRRKERLSKIKIGVSAAESSPDWDVLALRNQLFREQAEEEAYRKSEEEWGKLRQHMFARKDELIQRVLNSRISGF